MGYAGIEKDGLMRILIRAEGGYRIGMGHVMRMLVLADKLRVFSEVVFVCKDNDEFKAGADYIEACGFPVLRIDETRLLGGLAGMQGDCFITDSYDVDEGYFNSIKEIFRVTGYMDDLNKHRINADFIINQNIYAGDLEYKTGNSTRLFLGTRYALLREEFRKLPKRNIRSSIQDVLITVGGADPHNLSEVLVLRLSSFFPETRFHIVVGPYFTYKDSLRKIARDNIYLHHNPKMSELMQKCDAAISACGSTIYELCACGTPIIGVVTADNQAMAARRMNSFGTLRYAESPEKAAKHLENLNYEARVRMSEKGQGLVDGHGSTRLAEEINRIINNKG